MNSVIGTTEASPSALNGSGNAFSVAYKGSGL
jgi:hypothetical protein